MNHVRYQIVNRSDGLLFKPENDYRVQLPMGDEILLLIMTREELVAVRETLDSVLDVEEARE